MAFTGNEGAPISLDTAKRWIKKYQDKAKSQDPDKTPIKAHFFGSERINKLLNEKDAKGIRIYYGINDKEENTLLLVSAKADMDNILPSAAEEGGGGPIILDDSYACPPYCPKNGI